MPWSLSPPEKTLSRLFGRKSQLLSSSPEDLLSLSLPPNSSPIREKRKLFDEERTPPKDGKTIPIAIETQPMAITSYLYRMEQTTLPVGTAVSKLELFCTQTRVAEAVYRDSLVFQCLLCSGNRTEGSIAC